MTPIYLTVALFIVAFACVLGLCEWILRRRRGSPDDDRSPTG